MMERIASPLGCGMGPVDDISHLLADVCHLDRQVQAPPDSPSRQGRSLSSYRKVYGLCPNPKPPQVQQPRPSERPVTAPGRARLMIAASAQVLDSSPRGMSPPGVLATRLVRGAVVQLRHHCPRVKRDGTAGLVGCWIRRPPKAAPLSRRVRPPASIALDRDHGQPPAAGHGRWPGEDAPSARAASLASSAALPVLTPEPPWARPSTLR